MKDFIDSWDDNIELFRNFIATSSPLHIPFLTSPNVPFPISEFSSISNSLNVISKLLLKLREYEDNLHQMLFLMQFYVHLHM